jgi:hypothetical protein
MVGVDWASARVGLARGVVASSAACTVNAAAVAICGSADPLVGMLQAVNNAIATRKVIRFFFIFLQ